jgi:hypothetical protein
MASVNATCSGKMPCALARWFAARGGTGCYGCRMRQRGRRVLLALVMTSACSTTPPPPPDAGPQPTGYGGGCPSSSPEAGAACSNAGTECEYPTGEEFCANVLQCVSGAYVSEVGYCGTPNITGSFCATTFAGTPVGSACQTIVQCDYKDGRCSCSNYVDGGIVDGGALKWSCTSTPLGCPSARPFLGMNCAPEGRVCDYGACSVEDTTFASPLALRCSGGIWVRAGCGT